MPFLEHNGKNRHLAFAPDGTRPAGQYGFKPLVKRQEAIGPDRSLLTPLLTRSRGRGAISHSPERDRNGGYKLG